MSAIYSAADKTPSNLQPRCNHGHRKYSKNLAETCKLMGSEWFRARRFYGFLVFREIGAGDQIRTDDPNLGKRGIEPFTD
jgi:hypothetical protein